MSWSSCRTTELRERRAGPVPYDAYWLHKELGPVKLGHLELVAIDDEVAVEPKTWSSVKSLYR